MIRLRRALFLISAPIVYINFALPLRAEDIGASAIEIGVLFSLFTAAVFIIRPIAGVGLDYFGRRPFFILAALFYLGANVLYAVHDSIFGLYVARLCQGLGFAVLTIAAETMVADVSAPEDRAREMGANLASQARGAMAGGFFAFTLVGAAPDIAWPVSFSIFAALSVFAIVFIVRALPESRPARDEALNEIDAAKPNLHFLLLVVIFLASFASALVQPFYLVYMRSRFDVDMLALATAFLPLGIASAIFPRFLGKAADRGNRAVIVALGLSASAVLYASIAQLEHYYAVVGAFVAAAIGAMLMDVTKSAWIADKSTRNAAGRTFALAAFASGLGSIAGPLAGGLVYGKLGADALLYACAGVYAAAAIIALQLKKEGARP
ncbi:MAG: MFS transporter [Parvularculaceae bacterium]|nr:MFS transporter [Parvularculaceae bacterium]